MHKSMKYFIDENVNAAQHSHGAFDNDKLGFMVEHHLIEKYDATCSPNFAYS